MLCVVFENNVLLSSDVMTLSRNIDIIVILYCVHDTVAVNKSLQAMNKGPNTGADPGFGHGGGGARFHMRAKRVTSEASINQLGVRGALKAPREFF